MAASDSTGTRLRNLTGQQFGDLIVLMRVANSESNMPRWLCQCKCGSLPTVVYARNLRTGNTTSCGCAHKAMMRQAKRTHGQRRTTTYSIWANMKSRCLNSNVPAYKTYGARGITVCERWLTFANFLADMGERPGQCELDRRDNNGHYEPDNCRWVTPIVNANNTSRNRRVEFDGEMLTLAELARKSGINSPTLRARVDVLGWSLDRAANTPVRRLVRSK